MLKKIGYSVLCILLGAVFIFSAITKLYPIEPFEYTFVDLGISNWKLAPFIARFFIGLEFFIGALLILNLRIKTTCKIAAAALALFSLYLVGLIFLTGNKGNCGCFGNYFFMTPAQALAKNLIMLALLWLLYKYYDGVLLFSPSGYLPTTYRRVALRMANSPLWGAGGLCYFLAIASLITPHILNYVDMDYSEAYLSVHEDHYKLELDSLYKNAKINVPPASLSTGKHVLAFMSLTCPHCRVAAKKMKIIKERNPEISMYFILNGDDNKIEPFFEETHAENIPYCILLGS
ncbi:MAG: hypothetical protein HY252_12950, partial [Sphingobacteriales bacterium]|nr:hypothetical protein [Sphingobacteriales bacterium]